MMQFDRISLGRQAKELGFVRDTFEKVCRLADVLSFMESDALLSDTLAFRNIANEFYAKDTSKKVRSAKRARVLAGMYMGGSAP